MSVVLCLVLIARGPITPREEVLAECIIRCRVGDAVHSSTPNRRGGGGPHSRGGGGGEEGDSR